MFAFWQKPAATKTAYSTRDFRPWISCESLRMSTSATQQDLQQIRDHILNAMARNEHEQAERIRTANCSLEPIEMAAAFVHAEIAFSKIRTPIAPTISSTLVWGTDGYMIHRNGDMDPYLAGIEPPAVVTAVFSPIHGAQEGAEKAKYATQVWLARRRLRHIGMARVELDFTDKIGDPYKHGKMSQVWLSLYTNELNFTALFELRKKPAVSKGWIGKWDLTILNDDGPYDEWLIPGVLAPSEEIVAAMEQFGGKSLTPKQGFTQWRTPGNVDEWIGDSEIEW